ncbi:hypothetical protein B0T10DRAFT_533903 [Thelonectria olida]|uniref:TM2 domain-containing protein n=1 Tax=Thelonectria olida TaxID=1576542 RepID=A0A9P9AGW7_9HYPO|nr:hypothetical protein B0T10DRAFT_533903 [Thelonectria olida]
MATVTAKDITRGLRLVAGHWQHVTLCHAVLICGLLLKLTSTPSNLTKRDWGGWGERPQTEQCYKQERTATLLALYLGAFGADHWYARHWILAIFKLLTVGGFGIWAIVDVTLWIVGGYYGTPGCPGGSDREWLY